MPKYISVVIENNTRYTDSFFTYKVPDAIHDIGIGYVVTVPFGKGNKELRAYVFDVIEEDKLQELKIDESKIKSIKEIDSEIVLTPEIISTCKWMKMRYGIKYIDAIRCFVPIGKAAREGKEKRPIQDIEADVVEIEDLNPEQKKAIGSINLAIEEGIQKNFLIHGVTGSGKTEVYMQAIRKCIDLGKTAIMLVPEIALTKQITERFIGRFGRERVAILHSKLTPRERFDEWSRIRSKRADIVIGARLAVFAPLENIGLILMDEEHEQTYKSDKNPKYDTLDVALKRIMYYSGVLVLGSATPSVVTYQRTKEGIFEKISLTQRYNGTEMPDIEIVDMRSELRHGNRSMFSYRLREEIENSLSIGEQSILFLNRRGYSNFISCRECGEAVRCEECGISMTYHKERNALVCHYCGKTVPVPKTCPACGSKYIKHFGVGTEQVEEYTKKEFPNARISRLDLDTAKNKREINRIIGDFAKGNTDILIGTQLVAKGLDFKNVGLVGVIAADASLNIPDYRSGERTFQLITQVAGRAGRGDKKGKVIVQTYSPDNLAISAASKYDYESYFNQEAEFRKLMGYPPFSDLILVEFTHKNEDAAEKTALGFFDYIKEYTDGLKTKGIERDVFSNDDIFSPRISKGFKGTKGDSYRYYVLIKSRRIEGPITNKINDSNEHKQRINKRNYYLAGITRFIEKMIKERDACSVVVDVNPYSTI